MAPSSRKLLACYFLVSLEAEAARYSGTTKSTATTNGYSTDAICYQYNCINPVVPGLMDLSVLESTTWECQDANQVKEYMNFCKDAVYYSPGVPSPKSEIVLAEAVKAQDDAAATMYFFALSGMNIDPWPHKEPWKETSSCLINVWKTVCSTYFPRAEAGCLAGQPTRYLRPCKNVCENYLKACQVQCCDESVQCVFTQTVSLMEGGSNTTISGYVNEDGPSAMCTGTAAPNTVGIVSSFLLLALLFSLQKPE